MSILAKPECGTEFGAAQITPVEGEPTRFWVESSRTGQPPHMVDLDDDGKAGCSCHDFMCRNRECKHIRAVKAAVCDCRNPDGSFKFSGLAWNGHMPSCRLRNLAIRNRKG